MIHSWAGFIAHIGYKDSTNYWKTNTFTPPR